EAREKRGQEVDAYRVLAKEAHDGPARRDDGRDPARERLRGHSRRDLRVQARVGVASRVADGGENGGGQDERRPPGPGLGPGKGETSQDPALSRREIQTVRCTAVTALLTAITPSTQRAQVPLG